MPKASDQTDKRWRAVARRAIAESAAAKPKRGQVLVRALTHAISPDERAARWSLWESCIADNFAVPVPDGAVGWCVAITYGHEFPHIAAVALRGDRWAVASMTGDWCVVVGEEAALAALLKIHDAS